MLRAWWAWRIATKTKIQCSRFLLSPEGSRMSGIPSWKGLVMRRVLSPAIVMLFSGGSSAVDLQGHRGARGLAPENTLPAFAKGLEIGVTTLELDTGITRDGVVVISHEVR